MLLLQKTMHFSTQQFVTSFTEKAKLWKSWQTMNQVFISSQNGGNNFTAKAKVKTRKVFSQQA